MKIFLIGIGVLISFMLGVKLGEYKQGKEQDAKVIRIYTNTDEQRHIDRAISDLEGNGDVITAQYDSAHIYYRFECTPPCEFPHDTIYFK